jgi:hypothetical protein
MTEGATVAPFSCFGGRLAATFLAVSPHCFEQLVAG